MKKTSQPPPKHFFQSSKTAPRSPSLASASARKAARIPTVEHVEQEELSYPANIHLQKEINIAKLETFISQLWTILLYGLPPNKHIWQISFRLFELAPKEKCNDPFSQMIENKARDLYFVMEEIVSKSTLFQKNLISAISQHPIEGGGNWYLSLKYFPKKIRKDYLKDLGAEGSKGREATIEEGESLTELRNDVFEDLLHSNFKGAGYYLQMLHAIFC